MKRYDFLQQVQTEIGDRWIKEMMASPGVRADAYGKEKLEAQCRAFLKAFVEVYAMGSEFDQRSLIGEELNALILDVARSRASLGYSSGETAHFIFSLRSVLSKLFSERLAGQPEELLQESMRLNDLCERLAVITMESFMETREQLIQAQAQSILELSNPVIKIWDRVLLCVLIGTVDTARSQQLLESILEGIKKMEARVAIIDITGVQVIDTSVLKHIFTIIRGIRMMGCQVIITGVNPSVASCVTKLDVDLSLFNPKGTLRQGLQDALAIVEPRSA
ncbi:STAS domain-containing protein [Pelagicoccus sp. SDUM812003]|uniref:STAS domain-containing protein n=1 Tax=Pelagicoccus sp. SDUM812003 TaxID=3041267 RepID=UPI00280C56DC|nr:STAS domain-containing protein [Pelagicoccus sp. SDUM812003]MDQ8204341.1 STAS domain-containing protein [Pelagicoccus sp. SDUM812003]